MENNVQNDNQPTKACYSNTPTVTVLSKTLACVFDNEVVVICSYIARHLHLSCQQLLAIWNLHHVSTKANLGAFLQKHGISTASILCCVHLPTKFATKKEARKLASNFGFFAYFLQLNITRFCKDFCQFPHHGWAIFCTKNHCYRVN